MKRNRFGMLGAGFALALGALGMAGANAGKAMAQVTQTAQDFKATKAESQREVPGPDQRKTYNPLASLMHDAGMSPKEYGLRYGSGGTKKSNRLRLSHNAKLKRR